MLGQFGVVLIFIVIGSLFIFAMLAIGSRIRPNRPGEIKNSSYECGEEPVGNAFTNYNIRFYRVAPIFIIFEAEIALMFPASVHFRSMIAEGSKWIAFAELFLFIAVFFLGLIFLLSRGYLEWSKGDETGSAVAKVRGG
jgi:NADH-quinone oxidoreductase subunit A